MPTKKRRRGPLEEEGRSQTHLSRVGQIQRCSNCGVAGHKRSDCPNPSTSAQRPSEAKKGKGSILAREAVRGPPHSHLPIPSPKKGHLQGFIISASTSTGCSKAQPEAHQQNSTKKRSKKEAAHGQSSSQPTRSAKKAALPPPSHSSQPPKNSASGSNCASQASEKRSQFSVSLAHISPQKLRKMAKLPPSKWGNL
ncbi:hypothetical protein PIB30_008474 [Stylosanthes scabra]|uniref:CCHC-type domain-containing protein n=1 Tax=Stylosanthes scabra TaxID=79078 RepID=A0ABU6X5M6_9FABA|nr:hypothetical protein [Stylosanthes scabra]